MDIHQALGDPQLLGTTFARNPASWAPWKTFLAAAYGLPLADEQLALYRKATGRDVLPPEGGHREVVAIVGRQAGKTKIGALIACYEAAFAAPCDDGDRYVILVAQDHRAALRAAFSYMKAALEGSPVLSREIADVTSDRITLRNGVHLAAYPCRPASVRGLRALAVVLDELAFFRSSEGLDVGLETVRASRPTLATTGGRLVIASSPSGQIGALFELDRKHFGRNSSTLVWRASAPEMNPTLPADYLERMREDDPEAYRSEVLGEFRAGLTNLLDPEAIDACVVRGRRELLPASGVTYQAFVDPSGGRRDAFAVAVAHRTADGRGVVDVLRAWPAPLNPGGVIAEAAGLLRSYRVSTVVGDRFGGEFPREAFRAHGIEYVVAERNRSEIYLEMVSLVNSGAIELLDDGALIRELRLLERRRGPSGRDRVDHPRGGHDDRANAAGGALVLVAGREERVAWVWDRDGWNPAGGASDKPTWNPARGEWVKRDRVVQF